MGDIKEVSDQLTDIVSNSTMLGASSLPKRKSKTRHANKTSSHLSYQQQHLLFEHLQSHIDLVAMSEADKKRAGPSTKLKKRMLEVSETNENLAKSLNEKNSEIMALKSSVQNLNDVLNSVPIDDMRCNSSIASVKILELSKRNRQLRVELETTKNRLSKREHEIQKLEKELKQAHERHKDNDLVRKNEKPSVVDEMHAQMSQLRQRVFELRNKNTELKNQLKMAQKCLQQEVGDNVNVNTILSNAAQNNWRGRAQQILSLQKKISELKERLDSIENNTQSAERMHSVSGMFDAMASQSMCNLAYFESSTVPGVASACSITDRFSTGVRKTEILHRSKVEALEKEITTRQMTIEDLRGKLLALKVRNKTLNDEVGKYKSKASSLEERTDFNVVNLDEMTDKLNAQRYEFEARVKDLNQKLQQMVHERDMAINREKDTILKLQSSHAELKLRDRTIHEMNMDIERLRDDLKAVCGDYLFACRELRKEEFIAILDALECEKNGLLLHVQTLSTRLEKERQKNETLTETISKQKTRISRAETRIRKYRDDHN